MANIRRLMAEARRSEESGDLETAIVLHRQALALQEETTGFADLSLYNGLGDLYLRAGELSKAVEAFEEAAQHCEDQQLYSNGIAVCKKILRNAPDRIDAYRREGRLLALSGLAAQSLTSYRSYFEHVKREGGTSETIEALTEFVDLTADDETALELADLMVAADRGREALTQLRAVRDRRQEQGRDVVALVRRIQELQPRYAAPAERSAGSGTPAAPARATTGPTPPFRSSPQPTPQAVSGDRAGVARGLPEIEASPAAAANSDAESVERVACTDGHASASRGGSESDSDVVTLMHELQDVLSRLDGEQKFRHALPIVEHLLEFEPGRFELLHRKLGYAYALGEEAASVAAYLALGECLDRHLRSFTIRALSTSTPDGDVKTALKVEKLPEAAPTS